MLTNHVLKSAEIEMKKHLDPYLEERLDFAPFAASCEGLMGKEACDLLCRLAKKLSEKWDRPCSCTASFARIRFATGLVRAKKGTLEAK